MAWISAQASDMLAYAPRMTNRAFSASALAVDRAHREPHSASDALTAAVLELLEAHVAVLDGRGTVVTDNPIGSAFEFAGSLGITVAKDREVNYVEVCRTAAAAGT